MPFAIIRILCIIGDFFRIKQKNCSLLVTKQLPSNPRSKNSEETDYFELVFDLNQQWKRAILFRDEFLTSRCSISKFGKHSVVIQVNGIKKFPIVQFASYNWVFRRNFQFVNLIHLHVCLKVNSVYYKRVSLITEEIWYSFPRQWLVIWPKQYWNTIIN